ncbi:methyl-accepting chemotaxis protein [Actinotalea sp. BY-33]|uniref:Methyl-accepting chemotaxis protein n=1 Tax=Actinotalea soli TaxID=2819234 RepID=A0A939LPE2_9CELL|nr:methyl-accepting chemotaxis protein [Actinotalea soli]MBO1751439.1 methyl-accepting chemotaxis protein [Actinotalea soli]
MITALQRFPIGQRLIALVLLPLLALVAVAGQGVLDRDAERRDAETVVMLTGLAGMAGDVAHALQRERGATSLYVSSRGERFGAELSGFRAEADDAVAALLAYATEHADALPEAVGAATSAATDGTSALDGLRSAADGFSRPVTELIPEYTVVVTAVLDVLPPVVAATTDAVEARRLAALDALMTAKERAGVERAQLSNVFTNDEFGPGQVVTVASLVAGREQSLATFASLADDEARASLTVLLGDPAVVAAAELEESALARPEGGFDVDPTEWFEQATVRIDALKALEDGFAAHITDRAATVRDDARNAMLLAVGTAVLALVLTVGLAVAIILSIRRPLRRTVEVLEGVARGELDHELVVPAHARDEVAEMSRSLNTATASLRDTLRRMRDTSHALASAATELDQVSATVGEAVDASAEQARAVSASAGEVSANVDSVAAATEQMGAAVHEIARHASEAATVSSSAAAMAQTANNSVSALEASSSRIEEVVKTVASIANQTNLLALNATIEAARAGASGKGFAVVAGEVKELAQETSTATEDIAQRITVLREDARVAVDAIGQITAIVARIDESQAQIAAAVEEQSATTASITEHALGAAGSTDRIASGASRVAENAVQETESLGGLNDAARDLAAMAVELDGALQGFRF